MIKIIMNENKNCGDDNDDDDDDDLKLYSVELYDEW
jgi:hypothetical protein